MLPTHRMKTYRWITRISFFVLFCIAPLFDLFRFDLDQGHFYLLTFHWSIGIGEESQQASLASNLVFYGLLPIVVFLTFCFWIFYRYGRLYCGWLCPHFGVVEMVNYALRRTIAKHSIWDREQLPKQQVDGSTLTPEKSWWWLVALCAVSMAMLWSIVLMTYVLNPIEVYQGLWNRSLSDGQWIFLAVATAVLTTEFLFARHLFCRFGCAVGMFQSLAWMSNRHALVVSFDRTKAAQCKDCNNFCDHACPMRLKPRGKKRHMFSCTQCTQCLQACDIAQNGHPVLSWKKGSDDDSVAIPLQFYFSDKGE